MNSTDENEMTATANLTTAPTMPSRNIERPKLEHSRMGRLSLYGDGMNFDIPSNQGTKEHIVAVHGNDSWQCYILTIIHSKTVEYTLASLLALDIILLFGELLLLSYYPHCSLIIRDGYSCCSNFNITSSSEEDTNSTLARWLEASLESSSSSSSEHEMGMEHEEICEYPSILDPTYMVGCNEHRYPGVHVTENVFFALTICILSIFMIELNLSMIALTPNIFFRQFFFALDYCIITISLVLEITFHTLSDELYQSLSGLLVIFRIWRFVRIGHGIVELTNEAAHREYEKLFDYTKELRDIIKQHSEIELPNRPEMDQFFTKMDVMNGSYHTNNNNNSSNGNDGEKG